MSDYVRVMLDHGIVVPNTPEAIEYAKEQIVKDVMYAVQAQLVRGLIGVDETDPDDPNDQPDPEIQKELQNYLARLRFED